MTGIEIIEKTVKENREKRRNEKYIHIYNESYTDMKKYICIMIKLYGKQARLIMNDKIRSYESNLYEYMEAQDLPATSYLYGAYLHGKIDAINESYYD